MNERSTDSQKVDPARALRIVEAVVELPVDVALERIERICAGQPELAAQARALLVDPPEGFLRPRESALEAARSEDAIGSILGGKYRLEERVGAGSMGVVYRGVNLNTRGAVAIKLLHETGASSEAELGAMVAEARAAAAIRHDNVIRVLDVDVYDGAPALVLEWVDGVDLATWTRHARAAGLFDGRVRTQDLQRFVEERLGAPCTGDLWSLPYEKAIARLMADTGRALQAAHEGGVVHRDVAPKNILLRSSGRPLLVDFGVALLEDESSRSRRAGLAGTLPYMAPEQFQPGRSLNRPAVDVYALGATLYELLTGEPPYQGNEGELIESILEAPTPDLRDVQPRSSRDLAAITFGAMEKRPAARYATAGEVAYELEAFLEGRPTVRRPVGRLGRLVRWTQRHPARASTAVAVGLLLVVGGTAAVQFKDSRERARSESFVEGVVRLPAMATIEADPRVEGPPRPTATDAGVGSLLDELIKLNASEPLLLWYRANWRSQHDDPDGAAEDLASLRALGHGGGLLEPLAAALTSAEPRRRNALVPPESLPEPRTPFEQALLGYVRLRFRDYEGAFDALTLAIDGEPDRWMYADLRSIAFQDGEALQASLGDAHTVETTLGRPTARSSCARAFVALNGEVRNADLALELYEQAVDLGGDYFPANNNCAVIWIERASDRLAIDRQGALECLARAEAHLERCEALRPGHWRPELHRARCELLRGDYEAAVERLENGIARFGAAPSWRAWDAMVALEQELALAQAQEAERLRRAGDEAGAGRLHDAARGRTQRLAERVGGSDPMLLAELNAMIALLDWLVEARTFEETIRALTQAQSAFAAASGARISPVIEAMRGKVFAKGGRDFEADARIALTAGLDDPRTKAVCEQALGQLADR